MARHLGPSLKFLTVGGLVFLLDAAMYNLLVFWSPTEGWGQGAMHPHPILAKILTIAVATSLTYLGNRLWTFGDRPRPRTARSVVLFVLINVIATVLQLGCLGFSRYVLGLDSALADNISGTLIGQIVSTSFRYVTYGRFVFPHHDDDIDDVEGRRGKAHDAVASSERTPRTGHSTPATPTHQP
ncbi:GtrA family protein [Brachybacterium endophyticum]|uniref:GtrA family protein n=2 Tax=Brachybacterium endophyticum TaxID=2182385 RepID=A0A2U2RK77_9MICO|nr:GtrA family protein [Brachybacterium endophyticum]